MTGDRGYVTYEDIDNLGNDRTTENGEVAEDYYSIRALSNSGMKDLAVSPLRYWHKHVNPVREVEQPTPEMQIGSAVHCAVLEPLEFHKCYACEFIAAPDALVTIEDLRRFLREAGITPKGTRKAEVIAQVQAVCPQAPIFDVQQARYLEEHAGKTIFEAGDWKRIQGAADSLLAEPRVVELLKDKTGRAEQPFLAVDPDTGIPLKAKMDWVAEKYTLDLKTFTQQRGKSIDKSVSSAIWYEGYYRQAYFYSYMRALASGSCIAAKAPESIMAFVESQPPHEVRLRSLRPKTGTEVNLFWERARIETTGLIRLYAECDKHFGDRPWRYAQEITPLADEELPGVIY